MRKMNIYRLFSIVFGIAFLSTIISCDVEVVQEDAIQATTLTEQEIIDIAYDVGGVMKWQSSNIPSANSHTFPAVFQDLRGGNCVSEANPVNWITGRDYNQFATITPTQASVQSYWSKWFTGINRANTTIYNLENIGISDSGLQTNLIAQSKFWRALFYFQLVKHYGGVPIRLEAVTTLDQAIALPRASKDEIYAQIVQDLTEALPDLANNPNEKYEPTQGAAYALLAKVSLYREDFTNAISYADMVTGYSLEDTYVDNFRLSTEGSRAETILEVDFVSGSTQGFEPAGEESINKGSAYYQMSGGIGGVNSVWNNFIPTQEFVDFFRDGDVRKLGTLVVGGEPQEGITGDDTSILSITQPAGAIQRKYYLTPDELVDLQNTSGNTQQTGNNDIYLRYADVLLIKAEAQIRSGQSGDAALGQVVERAGLTNTGGYTLEDLKYHRRAELSFEGYDQFTDLVRWGDAASFLADRGFSVGRDELLPIPQLEIEQSVGIVEQNPGY